MKQKQNTFKIENPCSQDWNSMNGNDIERFCSKCSKTVKDYTHFTEQQFLDEFLSSKGKICGRLKSSQLDSQFEKFEQRIPNSFFPRLLSGLFFLSLVDNTHATSNLNRIEIIEDFQMKSKVDESNKYEESPIDSLKNAVLGKIIDNETKEPIVSAIVLLYKTQLNTTTDVLGRYRLVIPDSVIKNQTTFQLIVIADGYIDKVVSIQTTELPLKLNIKIEREQVTIMGVISIEKKKKWWQFWKSNKRN